MVALVGWVGEGGAGCWFVVVGGRLAAFVGTVDGGAKWQGRNIAYMASKRRSRAVYHTGPLTPLTLFAPTTNSDHSTFHPASRNLHATTARITPRENTLYTSVGTPSLLHFSFINAVLVRFRAESEEK